MNVTQVGEDVSLHLKDGFFWASVPAESLVRAFVGFGRLSRVAWKPSVHIWFCLAFYVLSKKYPPAPLRPPPKYPLVRPRHVPIALLQNVKQHKQHGDIGSCNISSSGSISQSIHRIISLETSETNPVKAIAT